MSGLTSPAASPIALPATAAPPSVRALGVPSLAAFVDMMIGKIGPPGAKAGPGDPDRQGDAGTGNSLPDKDKPPIDPALAWLFGAPPMLITQSIAVPDPVPAPVIGVVAPEVPPADAVPMPASRAGKEIASPTTPQVESPLPQISPTTLDTKPDVSPPLAPPKTVAPPTMPLPPVAPPVTAALPALFALAMTPAHDGRDDDAPVGPVPLAAAVHAADTTPSIAPTGDTQRQTFDLGARDWPQKMIDHIEALRDNANANDTSIRLKPEALGRVDVALKTHSDGAISVRFTADRPATHILLVDAAPQLAAAAEARGIRLLGSSVDLSGQGDQRPRPDIKRPQNISNHLAAPNGNENQAIDDGRIA